MALMQAPAVTFGRCNPYGAEDGGPRHVMGGLHGPNSARIDTADLPGLPEAVVQGEWSCPQLATVRVRMVCECQHTGKIINLCAAHDETVYTSEIVAGQIRRVKSTVRVRGHYEEISRRQAAACIRCLFPGKYAALYKSIFAWQEELEILRQTGQWYSPRGYSVRQTIEDITKEFDEGNADGTIHRCPMTLVPVS